MPYRKKGRHYALPLGVIALLFALIFGFITVVAQYEHVQNVQQEQAASASSAALAQKQAFIQRLAPYAQTLRVDYGVLPSITLAQAILESDWGTSKLSSDYHNLFGVKASSSQPGQELTTREWVNGQWKTVTARFRVYSDDYASMRDHALLLDNGTSWNTHQYQTVIAASDYQTAARALQTSGYATDPNYASKLIAIIQKYQLNKYDGNK
ncbi:glycoside hydrolase family 73 protein [Lacticaseibacillus zhaodongensis]|uniref:glycoside hydrolase family 73 protein n=1 Tax=Lacticaseibacillus zhaodongensis TaxID=2668065 RepID=UPI0012D2CFAE|nr:glycoside hydrolase family 73 protein [Lacticaseibacillus zhaodongensis]